MAKITVAEIVNTLVVLADQFDREGKTVAARAVDIVIKKIAAAPKKNVLFPQKEEFITQPAQVFDWSKLSPDDQEEANFVMGLPDAQMSREQKVSTLLNMFAKKMYPENMPTPKYKKTTKKLDEAAKFLAKEEAPAPEESEEEISTEVDREPVADEELKDFMKQIEDEIAAEKAAGTYIEPEVETDEVDDVESFWR